MVSLRLEIGIRSIHGVGLGLLFTKANPSVPTGICVISKRRLRNAFSPGSSIAEDLGSIQCSGGPRGFPPHTVFEQGKYANDHKDCKAEARFRILRYWPSMDRYRSRMTSSVRTETV